MHSPCRVASCCCTMLIALCRIGKKYYMYAWARWTSHRIASLDIPSRTAIGAKIFWHWHALTCACFAGEEFRTIAAPTSERAKKRVPSDRHEAHQHSRRRPHHAHTKLGTDNRFADAVCWSNAFAGDMLGDGPEIARRVRKVWIRSTQKKKHNTERESLARWMFISVESHAFAKWLRTQCISCKKSASTRMHRRRRRRCCCNTPKSAPDAGLAMTAVTLKMRAWHTQTVHNRRFRH